MYISKAYIPKNRTELELFRQQIIRECKLKYKPKPFQIKANEFLNRFRMIIPLNIGVGVVASAVYLYLYGGLSYFKLLLTSTIWITLTSTIIGAIIGKK